ncbi:MAG: phosphodiester glycosidase family protein [Balneolaceae bacterium]|nr:MAG: phosphodiester glycosidase family protein [Balneolaceae bacterium]
MNADTAAARFRLEAADRVEKSHPPEEPVRHLTASEFAGAFDPLAVINAGFFSDHPEYVSSGIFKVRGEVYPFQKEEPDELRFVGSSAIGIDEDGNWLFRNREDDAWPDDWPEAHTAVAGAHRLIENSVIPEPVASESYISMREQRHAGLRHPRTAICLADVTTGHAGKRDSELRRSDTANSGSRTFDERHVGTETAEPGHPNIIILVADGRHEKAAGLSLRELAELMLSMGCVDAVNLDGGGSSTMYIRSHGVVNHPSGNEVFDHEGERAVRTVIMIE